MKREIKEIDQCTRELTITVESEKALEDYRKVLKKYQKLAAIPGFRKGKAPFSMVENMYGSYAQEEYVNEYMESYYQKALDEGDIQPVSAAEPVKVDWKKGQDFVAVFKFDVKPDFEIQKYLDLEIPFEEVVLTDEAVDHTIEEMRKKMGTIEEIKEEISNGDLVTISFTFPEMEGENKTPIEREIEVGNHQYIEALDDELIGRRAGEVVESILFAEKEGEEKSNKFANQKARIEIKKVKTNVMPKLDDEFAKDADYENLAEMKEKIREELQADITRRNKETYDESVTYTLIKENPFKVPNALIESYAKDMAKPAADAYNIPIDKLLPQYRMMAEIQIKKFYILDKLKQIENIEVNENDLEEMITEAAMNLNISVEEYKEKYKAVIDGERFKDAIIDKKIYDLIKASSKTVPYPANLNNENEDGIEDAEIIEESEE